MSRWLKSVNSLLENLDGKAEEVAGDTQVLQKIIGTGYPKVDEDDDDEGESTDDADEDYYEDDDIEEEEEEGSDGDEDDNAHKSKGVKEPLKYESMPDFRQQLQDAGSAFTVSDISYSTMSDSSIPLEEEKPAMKGSHNDSSHMGRKGGDNEENDNQDDPHHEDAPPQAPNRHVSSSEDLNSMSTKGHLEQPALTLLTGAPPGSAKTTMVSIKNTKQDESPRFPKRSIEEDADDLPAAGASLLEDSDDEVPGLLKKTKDAAPPQQPLRSPSVASSAVETKKEPIVTQSSSLSQAPASNPKVSKENQNLKEKIQALQAQLTKTANELKTTQTQVQALTSQTRTLETKLESANAEIQAQSEELQRAGERMEKDRARAQEEREDLLDEQEEELEQVHQAHKTEVDGIRKQYESQIADLMNQLRTEETRRRQEGGDYTQELHDAIERERGALKQLNDVVTESTQLRTTISQLEQQQTALQSKLDAALQSVKTATEREREAEDKLDSSMSLHSRQTRQRQSREAELEKTIFDLGTALTLARQKQPVLTKADASDFAGESFKDKYMVVAEEVESLKVQLHMETQRREALQEELNDISRERSEEVSSAQARQRMQDRKVSEMEMTISRLKAQAQEHKGKHVGSPGKDPALLSQELEETRRDIESLSLQLVRQQNLAENAKSEVVALKGRLQASASRAEQAEKSLQIAHATRSAGGTTNNRLYEMEGGGVAGMRRRVKGAARSRHYGTIRSALQMSPGRTSNPFMEQVAMTLDALDSWMVESGSFLRHEPLARLAFMLYLILLHLWSFALVVFHTAEEPHADFGSMDTNPRHWRAAAEARRGG